MEEKTSQARQTPSPIMYYEEAAEYLKVSVRTLKRWIKGGKLLPLKSPGGRPHFTLAILQQHLQEREAARIHKMDQW